MEVKFALPTPALPVLSRFCNCLHAAEPHPFLSPDFRRAAGDRARGRKCSGSPGENHARA